MYYIFVRLNLTYLPANNLRRISTIYARGYLQGSENDRVVTIGICKHYIFRLYFFFAYIWIIALSSPLFTLPLNLILLFPNSTKLVEISKDICNKATTIVTSLKDINGSIPRCVQVAIN